MRVGVCEWCSVEYPKKRPEQRFCSLSHSKMGRSGDLNNGWKGGRRVHKQSGRITVLDNGRHVLEHRKVTGAPEGLVVHHKDGDFTNNDPANLELMPRKEHTRMHNFLAPRRDHVRDTEGRFKTKRRELCV